MRGERGRRRRKPMPQQLGDSITRRRLAEIAGTPYGCRAPLRSPTSNFGAVAVGGQLDGTGGSVEVCVLQEGLVHSDRAAGSEKLPFRALAEGLEEGIPGLAGGLRQSRKVGEEGR